MRPLEEYTNLILVIVTAKWDKKEVCVNENIYWEQQIYSLGIDETSHTIAWSKKQMFSVANTHCITTSVYTLWSGQLGV